jgi:hypothetical protein
MRSESGDLLTVIDQKPLQWAGDVSAVLHDPDTIDMQVAGPGEQLAEPITDRRGLAVGDLSTDRVDGDRPVRVLVRVDPDRHHPEVLSCRSAVEADDRRTRLGWGAATLLSGHAGGP